MCVYMLACVCMCVCVCVCMRVHIEERTVGGHACEAGVETPVCIRVKGEGVCACVCSAAGACMKPVGM